MPPTCFDPLWITSGNNHTNQLCIKYDFIELQKNLSLAVGVTNKKKGFEFVTSGEVC